MPGHWWSLFWWVSLIICSFSEWRWHGKCVKCSNCVVEQKKNLSTLCVQCCRFDARTERWGSDILQHSNGVICSISTWTLLHCAMHDVTGICLQRLYDDPSDPGKDNSRFTNISSVAFIMRNWSTECNTNLFYCLTFLASAVPARCRLVIEVLIQTTRKGST